MALVNLSVKLRRLRWLVVVHQINISDLQLARLSTTDAIWRLTEPIRRLPLFNVSQELFHSLVIDFLFLVHNLRHALQFLLFFLDIKQPRWQKR